MVVGDAAVDANKRASHACFDTLQSSATTNVGLQMRKEVLLCYFSGTPNDGSVEKSHQQTH